MLLEDAETHFEFSLTQTSLQLVSSVRIKLFHQTELVQREITAGKILIFITFPQNTYSPDQNHSFKWLILASRTIITIKGL